MPPPKIRRLVWGAALLICAVVAAFALRRQQPAPATAPVPGPIELAAADIAVAQLGQLRRELTLTGRVQPVKQLIVKARVAGELRAVHGVAGQSVRANQLLAEIDPRDLRARIDERRAAIEAEQAQLDMAHRNLETNRALHAQSFISANALDTTERQVSWHEANLRSLRAQLALAENAAQDAVVRAPSAGQIAERWAEAGEKVKLDQRLFSIVDLRRLEVEAEVPASDIARVQVGQSVAWQVEGFAAQDFRGTVERINPMTNAGSGSVVVYVGLDNPQQMIKGGSFASGKLLLESRAQVLTVPTDAIQREGAASYVLRLEAGVLRRRDLRLGELDRAADRVEVLSGLVAGDRVLRSVQASWRDGQAVSLPRP